jgi:two-component system sensor histidine kinase and response regulator WspE
MKRPDDLSQLSMLELFRVEVENQTGVLTNGLLGLERGEETQLETLMRAAHSLKGAARIVNFQPAVPVAHAMEDCFVAAQKGLLKLGQTEIDVLFRGVDLLHQIAKGTEAEIAKWETDHPGQIDQYIKSLRVFTLPPQPRAEAAKSSPQERGKHEQPTHAASKGTTDKGLLSPALSSTGGEGKDPIAAKPESARSTEVALSERMTAEPHTAEARKAETSDRVLRMTADSLNRLLGLAGESLVESRWLRPFGDSLQRLKRQQSELGQKLDKLRQSLEDEQGSERHELQLHDLRRQVADSQQFLSERMEELDLYDRRSAHLSHRLYLEVLRTRMRPFGDGTRRFPRMVRDLARSLGKEVKLEIIGENTQVDRDILDRLETPLAHLLRNAVDHGCEMPADRERAGKVPEGTIRIEARHSAGMLLVTVTDDGVGVQPERLRAAIASKKLAPPPAAEKLSESELLEFLFVPGFSLKDTVTEISGRGVGLDVVQNMVKSVRGAIRVSTQPGRGMRVQLQLPLTLSVVRGLLVEVAAEPYAIPLSQISRTLKLPTTKVQTLEGREHVEFAGQQIGLLSAHQVFDCEGTRPSGAELAVVVLGERSTRYGLVVDRFLGERELVVQPLDTRLGKVRDISAAALMEDGSPALIVDVDDMVKSIEKLVSGGRLAPVLEGARGSSTRKRKRVLVVDDSLSVRELERKLLAARGYETDTAPNGRDAWNVVHTRAYDLVVTDVEMPGMDGVELAALIKGDRFLKSVPVMIVSYKDSEADRLRGLEAGADYYLTKGNFDDEALAQAVVDLIGEA